MKRKVVLMLFAIVSASACVPWTLGTCDLTRPPHAPLFPHAEGKTWDNASRDVFIEPGEALAEGQSWATPSGSAGASRPDRRATEF